MHLNGVDLTYGETLILTQGKSQKRACGNDVERPQVFAEILKRGNSIGYFLNLIEEKECLARLNLHFVVDLDSVDDALDVENYTFMREYPNKIAFL
jgi:hypothetical protein